MKPPEVGRIHAIGTIGTDPITRFRDPHARWSGMSSKQTTIRTYDGVDARVRHLENVKEGRRLKVSHPDGRQWVVTLALPSGEVTVEVTRRDGEAADLETPGWLRDRLARLAQPA